MAISAPFIECRVRLPALPMPRSIRASRSRKYPSSSSWSLIASHAYRSQPACDVQSRVSAAQRSARARTPGTCDATLVTKMSTRT